MDIVAERNGARDAQAFVDELRQNTHVSEAFLTAALPSIEVVFSSVEPAARPALLAVIREAAQRQAETEAILDSAEAQVARLEASQTRTMTQLHHMAASVERCRDSLAAATLFLYRAIAGDVGGTVKT